MSAIDAHGEHSWNDERLESSSGQSGLGIFSGITSLRQRAQDGSDTRSTSEPVEHASFPSGGGRALGGAMRRTGHVDPRQARLQAIERRAAETETA